MNGQERTSKKEGRKCDNGNSNTKYTFWQTVKTKIIDCRYVRVFSDSRNANYFSLSLSLSLSHISLKS